LRFDNVKELGIQPGGSRAEITPDFIAKTVNFESKKYSLTNLFVRVKKEVEGFTLPWDGVSNALSK